MSRRDSPRKNLMRKVDQYSVATRIIKPGFDWSIGFDKHIDAR
jgi:hypothetical protein